MMAKEKEKSPVDDLKKSFDHLEKFKFDPRKKYSQMDIVKAASLLKDIELLAKQNHKALQSKLMTIVKGNLPNKDN